MLSDPAKRKEYDDSLYSNQVIDVLLKTGAGQSYNWKNPEFDPSYNHFASEAKNYGPKVGKGEKGLFEKFDMNLRCPWIKKNYMNVGFG